MSETMNYMKYVYRHELNGLKKLVSELQASFRDLDRRLSNLEIFIEELEYRRRNKD